MNDEPAAGQDEVRWRRWSRLAQQSVGQLLSWGAPRRWIDRGRPFSWLLLLTWGAWRLEPFYRVGMATQDQVDFSLQGTGDFWAGVVGHATQQRRVYFLLTKIVDLWIAARPEVWRVHVFNLVVFALSAVCFSAAVFRSRAQRLLYVWLFASVAWAGYHHLPPAAYPSVNHLPFLLWPLAAYLVRRKSEQGGEASGGSVLAFGVLAFVALFQYEPVAMMSLCVFAWLAYDTAQARLRQRLAAALGAAVLLYLATYLGWRAWFSASSGGVLAGEFSLWNVLRVTLAYSVGGLPFSEAYFDVMPLRFGDAHVGQVQLRNIAAEPQAWGVVALLFSAFALIALLRSHAAAVRASGGSERRGFAPWVLALVLLVAINGPLGLSLKYQAWVRDFDETYLTSQLALYPFVLVGTLVLSATYRRWRVRGVPLVFGALVAAVAASSVPVYAHNQRVTSQQRANLARWEGVAALASYARHIEEPVLVAPDLYYSMANGVEDWTKYWQRYVRQRFGGQLSFLPAPPAGGAPFALIRLYRLEDGQLRALSVQTDGYVAIVARPQHAPVALVTERGTGVPLDWRAAEVEAGSGYRSITLSTPAEILGTSQQIEPVWLWPQAPLATQR